MEIRSSYNFNTISNTWETNEIVNSIAIFCNSFDEEELKVECVHKLVTMNFNYDDRLPLDAVNQPKEILNYGGVCRDYSILYDSIFSLMGFETEFIFEPTHVYNKVYKVNCYYLDQEGFWNV